MGTRGLYVAIYNGKHHIAQYGQWDSYPSGQGARLLNFCRENLSSRTGQQAFIEKLVNCRFISNEEDRRCWDECGAEGKEFVSLDVAAKHDKKYPSLSRDTGAKIFDLILASEGPVPLTDEIEFAKDSLFCEWAYVVDLDKNTFEVYKGFNTEPLGENERFQGAPGAKGASGHTYYPIRHVRTYSLFDLPAEDEMFVQEIHSLTDEDEDEDKGAALEGKT